MLASRIVSEMIVRLDVFYQGLLDTGLLGQEKNQNKTLFS